MIESNSFNGFDYVAIGLGLVFLWSTLVVAVGLLIPRRKHPVADRKLRFAVLICARNEENVIRLPVKSVLMSSYPKDKREVIVVADNCTDKTAEAARAAGATVWEKTEPSSGKGDVLAWAINKVLERSDYYDAIAVFDADNVASAQWFDEMNNALNDGDVIATGRRMTSNATTNVISGWYTVYWDLMNELSNRVRTKLGLSGKLTGTGFAFLTTILEGKGWRTHTLVEDVEFSVQCNISGRRIGYISEAEYSDEQPVKVRHMWHQLCRWTTGGWHVAGLYLFPWLKAMFRRPSMRLFDSYFAILTGMSVAFVLLFAVLAFVIKVCLGGPVVQAAILCLAMFAFVAIVGLVTAWGAVFLSSKKRRPKWWAVLTFPAFSFILSASILWTIVFPTRRWKPIPHGNSEPEEM